MTSKFLWDLDMRHKFRVSKVVRFEIRECFKPACIFVDARFSNREAYPIKECESIEEARVFIEELTLAVS